MNRGFLYGDGFFETIRIIDGRIPLIQTHIDRIADALAIYDLYLSFDIDEDFIHGATSSYNKNGNLRINFFRDGQGKYLPESNEVSFDHSFEEHSQDFFLPTSLDLEAELKKAPTKPGSIALYPEPKPIVQWMTVKSLSSIYYVLAAKYKQESQADYLLIQNTDGYICEELISNILIQKGEDVFIPSLKGGGVNGATQRFLLRNYGFAITEKQLTMQDIETADAVYSCKGSTGVSRIK
ncbi:aminotransferase class IV [Bacteroidia bacterium]|nr:aminotransferase class IV [Bacteroidia bacterium]